MEQCFASHANFMLNLSPDPDGRIPAPLAARFAEIGARVSFPAPLTELPAGWLSGAEPGSRSPSFGICCRRRAMCSPERRNTMATFTNQATLTYNGGTVNSNIVTGELVQVLTASKTAAAESYRTGDLVTYVVQLRSTGAA